MKSNNALIVNLLLSVLLWGGTIRADSIDFTIGVLEDGTNQLRFSSIKGLSFADIAGHSINLGLTSSTYWFKIQVKNTGSDSIYLLQILNPNINDLTFYNATPQGYVVEKMPSSFQVYEREFKTQYPIFRIKVPPDSVEDYFIRASGRGVMEVPVIIGQNEVILERIADDQLYIGIYGGIIIVMSLYNFFLYLSIKDSQYLYYVLYILVVGLTQLCLKGYAAKFLWPDSGWLIANANHLVTVMSGIFAILFTLNFLRVKHFSKAVYNILCVAIGVHFFAAVVYVAGNYIVGQHLLQINTGFTSMVVLFAGFYIYNRKGYRPALFFCVAWSFFLTGVVIFILKDVGLLPYNTFTSNAILVGSGLEAALLSFALADKINIYKKEKEESQAKALRVSKENEKLIREQNIVLERKVAERTHALEETNHSLQEALTNLQETQAQLVEAEKMASLGQLTAGVAHEINNPINFVTSNVAPLKRDIGMLWDTIKKVEELAFAPDLTTEEKVRRIEAYKEEIDFDYLKTEIDFLLKGMREGAHRTAEIVKSLRIFSRSDGDSLKYANINEGLESTLVILNSVIREGTQVIREYGELPQVECYPGKLNQVFLNIITNGLYAINKKFAGQPGGTLSIRTVAELHHVLITIEDNGTGMPPEVKERIFDPFFTTKEVGEGTGLGMSIVYNTIKKHHGEIKVESEVGEGTVFTLSIPLTQHGE